jgi:hypothetical protein
MVGNPSLNGLRKICPSTAKNDELHRLCETSVSLREVAVAY